ncbi:MAG: Gfo/Idh/MocA family oxidoreductase [Candidatus Sumerlaeota bacterium]|nr:Gfo/Idh/MocA family oxidoreductase [Candidatus Sumerlaeota bacterium]
MSDAVRLALVGCGGIAGAHVKAYKELHNGGCRDFLYTACCDINEANAQQRAKEIADIQGAAPPVFTDHEKMIKAGVADGADCCLPHWLHHVLALPLLEGGLHVMLEKPLGLTVKASKKIIEAGKKAKRIVATAENIRRYQGARAFRWAIAEKKMIGEVRGAKTCQVANAPFKYESYTMKWRGLTMLTGGGMIMDSGAHYADMMIHMFGEPDEILCLSRNYDTRVIQDAPVFGSVPADVETSWDAILRFKSGLVATWTYSRAFYGQPMKFARYYGTEGTMVDDKIVFHPFQNGGSVVFADGRQMSSEEVVAEHLASLSDEKKSLLFPYGCGNGFGVQTWDFADAIRKGRKPEMDGEDGLRSKALSETCFESAAAGKPVRYDDVLSGKVSAFQDPIDAYWKL